MTMTEELVLEKLIILWELGSERVLYAISSRVIKDCNHCTGLYTSCLGLYGMVHGYACHKNFRFSYTDVADAVYSSPPPPIWPPPACFVAFALQISSTLSNKHADYVNISMQ